MKKILLISYLFPPCGESGVQRNLKYVKYLPQFGWKPYVLTVKDIVYHSYDPTLIIEVPPEATIIRTESLDPFRIGYLLHGRSLPQKNSKGSKKNIINSSLSLNFLRSFRNWMIFPDSSVGWLPFAVKRGLELIKEEKIDIILASLGPYSSAIAGCIISKLSGVPFIIDFRDGWTDDPHLIRPTRLHAAMHRFLEHKVVPSAAGICVYGDYLLERLMKRYPALSNSAITITHGFDTDDFDGIKPAPKATNRRRIVYCGSFYELYAPIFKNLIKSLLMLNGSVLETIEVVFVGRFEIFGAEAEITRNDLADHIKLTGYLSHKEALSYLLSADALLLVLPIGDIQAYSGKIFEYFAARKPIIACIEPEGTCAELLKKVGLADFIVKPDDAHMLASAIMKLSKHDWRFPTSASLEHFTRRNLTFRLSQFLEYVVDGNAES